MTDRERIELVADLRELLNEGYNDDLPASPIITYYNSGIRRLLYKYSQFKTE
jgi:hypothetical protein